MVGKFRYVVLIYPSSLSVKSDKPGRGMVFIQTLVNTLTKKGKKSFNLNRIDLIALPI